MLSPPKDARPPSDERDFPLLYLVVVSLSSLFVKPHIDDNVQKRSEGEYNQYSNNDHGAFPPSHAIFFNSSSAAAMCVRAALRC